MDLSSSGISLSQNPKVLYTVSAASSVTGTLSETTLASYTLPANLMGLNGKIRLTFCFSYTNNANTKTPRVKFGGTTYFSLTPTTTVGVYSYRDIYNRNSAASQIGQVAATAVPLAVSASALVTSTVDTSADVAIIATGQLTDIADTITLEFFTVELLK